MLDPKQQSDLTAGWQLDQIAGNTQPAIPDSAVAWGHVKDTYDNLDEFGSPKAPPAEAMTQMAGLGAAFRRARGLVARDIRERGQIPEASRIDLDNLRTTIRDLPAVLDPSVPPPDGKYIESGTINVTRHAPGASAQSYRDLYSYAQGDPARMLTAIENAEDASKLLDAIGRGMDMTDAPRTHASIRGMSPADILKEIEPIMDGRQVGLATDRQLYGLRVMLASIAEQTVAAGRMVLAQGSDEARLKFIQNAQAMIALQSMVTHNAREIARSLSQMRMIAGLLDAPSVQGLSEALSSMGTNPKSIDEIAQALLARLAAGQDQIVAVHQVMRKFDVLNAGIEFWVANMLSAPATHVINTGLSGLTHMYETFVLRPIAASVGLGRNMVGIGSGNRAYFAEAGEALAGSVFGTRDGLISAFKILMDPKYNGEFAGATRIEQGNAASNLGGEVAKSLGGSQELGMQVGHGLTAGLRLIRMEDEVVKSVAYRSEIGALAMRSGLDQGLSGNALTQHLTAFQAAPPYAAHLSALSYADKVTFQTQQIGGVIGGLAHGMLRATEQAPMLRFIAPFIRTPANLIDYAWKNSMGAPLNKAFYQDLAAGGARGDMAVARFIGAAGMMYLAYTLYSNGTITGPGPDNHEQRRVLEATGWKPNAVKVGDKLYTWGRADPFHLMMVSAIAALDKAAYAKTDLEVTNYLMDGILGMASEFLESSFVEGASDFVKIFFQEEKSAKFGQWTANMLQNFVPYASLQAAHARASEDTKHVSTKIPKLGIGGQGASEDLSRIIGQQFDLRSPGDRDLMRPGRWWDGSPMVPTAGYFTRLLLPVEISEYKNDKLTQELVKNGIQAPEPNALATFKGTQISLLDLDNGKGLVFDAYLKAIGEARREAVAEVVDDSGYNAASAGARSERALVLERAMREGLKAGQRKFWGEILPELVAKGGTSLSQLAVRMGTDPDTLLQDMREGGLKASPDLRFDSRGAPGKREIVPNIGFKP